MSTERIHDQVAVGYNSANTIIHTKNRELSARFIERWKPSPRPLRIIDLGVGDGTFLEMLWKSGVPMELTGVDVSSAMLDIARRRLPITTIQASAAEAASHAPQGSFDLVIAHHILAYVDPAELLAQARALLAPGGIVSLVTPTLNAGIPLFRELDERFRRSLDPRRRLAVEVIDRARARTYNPETFEAFLPTIEKAGLAVKERQTRNYPLVLADPKEAFQMGIVEGWVVNLLHSRYLPLRAMTWLAQYGMSLFTYPYECVQVVEMLELEAA